ncbi:MAG: hypothetical protein ABSB24_19065, partial [Gaiellaceae bacterium]
MAKKNKSVADPAKAKAAKQKKIVIALALVLVLAMAYALNTMKGLNSGGGAKPEAAPTTVATTTPASTTPTTTEPLTAPTLAGSQGTSSASTSSDGTSTTSDSSALVSAVQPPADAGQLQSFSRFASKDPFDSLGPKLSGTASSGSSGS